MDNYKQYYAKSVLEEFKKLNIPEDQASKTVFIGKVQKAWKTVIFEKHLKGTPVEALLEEVKTKFGINSVDP